MHIIGLLCRQGYANIWFAVKTFLGGEAVPYALKNRCCGGSLIISEESLALGLILIGLALGIDFESLGLDKNIVSPRPVMKHISRVKQEAASGA